MGKGRGRRWVAFVVIALAAAPSAAAAQQAETTAARQKESLPRRRGPRVPERLPAASAIHPELGSSAVAQTAARAPLAPGRRTAPPRAASPAPPAPAVADTSAREYADSLDALASKAAAYERSPEANYSYCIRVIATYENVYFGPDGELRRNYVRAVQHGTGFVYRVQNGESLLATNDHLANMPEVTGADAVVDGVPPGSRKVREALFIVRGEDDVYAAGFIELTKLLRDPANDLAILKARAALNVMPYAFGRSTDLRVGNIVLARGYPLGVLAASNIGRVTSSLHEDNEGSWDHLDFITDAALNIGNSGSPVLAISRRTGEPELVGIFHAQYRNATGMGVVIGIDEIRPVLETLRPSTPSADGTDAREEATQALARAGQVFFPFGGLTARALRVGGVVRFEVYEDFPTVEVPQVVISSSNAGPVLEVAEPDGGILAGSVGTPPLREPLVKLEGELWTALGETVRLRRALAADDGTPDAHRRASRLRRRVAARLGEQKQLLSLIGYETEGISSGERGAAARPRGSR